MHDPAAEPPHFPDQQLFDLVGAALGTLPALAQAQDRLEALQQFGMSAQLLHQALLTGGLLGLRTMVLCHGRNDLYTSRQKYTL